MSNAESKEQPSSTATTTAGSPKFREGDVVCFHVDQYRIDSLNGDLARVTWLSKTGEIPQRGPGVRMTELRLLRRPVRVGDVLTCRDAPEHRWRVTGLVNGIWYGADGCHLKPSELGTFGGWTHADGTPIEPPQAGEDGADAAFEQARQQWEQRVVDSAAAMMNAARQNQVDLQQQARYLERCADHVDGRAFKAVQVERDRLASRLTDARGVIATQEKKLIAVAEEEAWLKRELRRLDPRLYRARYERGNGR